MLYAIKQSKVMKTSLLQIGPRVLQVMHFSPATPIDHTYQCCAVSTVLHMLNLKIGKGHRLSTSMYTRHYIALQPTQDTGLSIPHCYYNGNVAMVHRVFARESSSLAHATISSIHVHLHQPRPP